MRTIIKNAIIISPFRKFAGAVVCDEGKIKEVIEGQQEIDEAGAEVIDAGGRYLSPGFIELHTHGAGGSDFLDNTDEDIINACRTHLSFGTTAILPTTLSSKDEELFDNFGRIRKIAQANLEGMPEILGVHLEGPYFNPEQNGAQDKNYIKNPTREEYERIFENCPEIKIWSVAPELPGAIEMGRWMKDNGIIASIGHSNAIFEEVQDAVENGYTMITHHFNGMSRLVRKNAKQYLGVAESGLLFDDLTSEIIADGCHLPPCLLKLIYKCKGPDRICLITDSMRAAGTDVSESILGSKASGQRVIIDGGVAYMPDRSSFGGSISTSDRLVRTMYHKADVPLIDAVRMITVTPARMLGVENRLGSIAPEKDADILLFDENINVGLVMIKGKVWKNNL